MTDNETNNNSNNTNLADYLAQLIKDKKQLSIFPNCFLHLERLLDEEINKIRTNLFQLSDVKVEPLELPEGVGTIVNCTEKIYVPIKDYPEFNFVGRILGPRGMTAKQLEYDTGCKIMVRGKGSMRDKKKEEQNRGKPNWEHLNDELHVLITVEDTENRCKVKLQRAKEEINKLLVPIAEGEDELKKRQLMELAIINGTYRDSKENKIVPNNLSNLIAGIRNSANQQQVSQIGQSSPGSLGFSSLGAPLIISPSQHHAHHHHLAAAHIAAAAHAAAARIQQPVPTFENLIYTTPNPYDYYLSLADLSPTNTNQNPHTHHLETSNVGKMMNLRRLTSLRDHPYLTPSTTTTTPP